MLRQFFSGFSSHIIKADLIKLLFKGQFEQGLICLLLPSSLNKYGKVVFLLGFSSHTVRKYINRYL